MSNTETVLSCRTWFRVIRSIALLSALLLVGVIPAASAQNAPKVPATQALEIPGPHAVGLKVVNQYDYSRSYRFSTDELGQPYHGERARPVQTLIWYPAQKSKAKPMTVADYLHFFATNARYDDGEKEEAQSRKEMASRLTLPMWAVSNAAMEAGRFPIVIYAPGMDDDEWENASLCEYLASYGYVVLASPSTALHGRFMDGDVAAGNGLARDIVFLLDYAQRLPDTDPSKAAVVGYSYGGLAALFAAARDNRIKAMVAMDGTMRFAPDLMKQAGDVHPEQMTIPLLFFGGLHRPDPAGDLKGDRGTDNVLYAWRHGDVTAIWMRHMKHGNYPSIEHRSTSITPDTRTHENEIITGRAWIACYTREFLDAHMKQNAAASAFLKKTPVENGVPASAISMTFRAAKGPAPTLEGFRSELGRQGFEHASDIYAAMHQEFPEFKLEESKLLNGWVYSLMNQNHSAEALGLLKAYLLACPNSREVYYLFGQAYEKAGQKLLAIESYKQALKIEPDFGPARTKLMTLENNTAPAE